MEPFPHHYTVTARAETAGSVALDAEGLPAIESSPPAEFGGPGDQWSPEALLVAAVADCFVLTFRAIARASKLEWKGLTCRAEGELDRVDRVTRFVAMKIHAQLEIPPEAKPDAARRLLEKAEKNCLVSNSLALTVELEPNITVSG